MKRILALLLALTMTLSLCACNGSGEEKTPAVEGLQTGYARESIMPEEKVNMAGYGNQSSRLSTGYLDILYATCLAASENDTTVLLFSLDLLRTERNWTDEFRVMISKATGVPEANIMFSATHTHSAPAPGGSEPQVLKWKEIVQAALLNAAEKAIADLAPTTLYSSAIETENMTFVRHYKLADGTYCGNNFGDSTLQKVDHATKSNQTMVVLKMDREGDKKDIALMNFQAHPCFTGSSGSTTLSADFVSDARNAFEADTGMHFIYFTGSAGNQNTSTYMPDEVAVGLKGREVYGQTLANYAVDALKTAEKSTGEGIKITQKMFTFKSNDMNQDRLEDARDVLAYKNSIGGDLVTSAAYAKSKGFESHFECQGIVNCSKYPPTQTMELNAISIGSVGFITFPGEMFSDTGLYIRENSPFKHTVLISLANETHGYFPTKQAYEYSSYESWSARFASGASEAVAEELVSMLKGL